MIGVLSGLDVIAEWSANDRVQPDVVGDRDRVGAGLLDSLHDLARQGPEAGGPALPVGLGDPDPEFHVKGPA
jgi:hypothetical protein